MTRHDHNLRAHVRNCRREDCDYCEALAEDMAYPPPPSDSDEDYFASLAEDRETRWREGA